MKNILFRSKTTPFDIYDPITYIESDKCGSNLGNLLYQHSVYKHLSTDNQKLVINNNSINLNKVDFINENYDHFVIPLANAFRPSYIKNLEKLTLFLKQIKIPITVVGVGAQTDHTGNFDNLKPINSAVKDFLSVVLDKSESIGVRGRLTQEYIETLGFKNQVDIIGCPSLFTFPEQIKGIKKQDQLGNNPKLSLNLSATGPQAAFSENLSNFEKTFFYNFNKYSDVCYIPQETKSLELLTYGINTKKGIEHSMLDKNTAERLFTENKIKFFLNSYSWFHYLSKRDFTFGTRLHGCIASLIAGTPAMLFAHDSRTLEIAEYFSIPHINLNNTNKIYDANEIYSMVDLGPLKQKYASNLDNYAKFLRKHNLETIVDNVNKMAEFDKRIKPEMLNLSVQPLTTQPESIGKRLHWLKNNYDYKLSKIKK